MMKYSLEIERQNAVIEIKTTPAKLNIRSKRPSFTINRTPAKANVEHRQPGTRKGKPAEPQSEPIDVLELSKRFEGNNGGAQEVFRVVASPRGGVRRASASKAAGASAAAEAAPNGGALEALDSELNGASWDPGYVKMNWEAHSIEVQWDVHPLEIEYEPYSVEITMKNYPSIRIRAHAERTHNLGRRVDRRI